MINSRIELWLTERVIELEKKLRGDVIFYNGPIIEDMVPAFDQAIAEKKSNKQTLYIILETRGGLIEPVEKVVEIIRNKYKKVHFIIPNQAMSAGTVFCMSGDKIFMSYKSSLGPIDPQIPKRNDPNMFVPALGYLDQFERMIEKSKIGELSPAEIYLLEQLDLADISFYEQARNLTTTLLQKWLVEYKFKNWGIHKTTAGKVGEKVTDTEKRARALEIANGLSDITRWHSHGRHIGMETLKKELRLLINDYTRLGCAKDIDMYYGSAIDYCLKMGYVFYMHTANFQRLIRR